MIDAAPIEVPSGVIHDVPASMDTEIARYWVEALRSGRWTQGSPFLRSVNDEFSAEGVLADLAEFHGVVSWENGTDGWFLPPYDTGTALPPSVREWAGCKGMHPSQMFPLEYEGERHPIWRLEDRFKLTFDQLADLIEAQYVQVP